MEKNNSASINNIFFNDYSNYLKYKKAMFLNDIQRVSDNNSISDCIKKDKYENDIFEKYLRHQMNIISGISEPACNEKMLKRYKVDLIRIENDFRVLDEEVLSNYLAIVCFRKTELLASLEKALVNAGINVMILEAVPDEAKIIEFYEKNSSGNIIFWGENIQGYSDSLLYLKNVFLHCINNFKKIKSNKSKCKIISIAFMNGKFGFFSENANYMMGSCSGLMKTIKKEFNESADTLFIDINPAISTEDIIKIVVNEYLNDEKRIEKSYYSLNEVYGLDFAEEALSDNSKAIYDDMVYIVSGGGSGVTAECILKLAKMSKCRFVIIGRTDIDEDDFLNTESKEELLNAIISHYKAQNTVFSLKDARYKLNKIIKIRQIKNNLEKLREYGADVLYYKCDVTDKNNLQLIINDAEKKLGRINGIIHGAGNIEDRYIYDKTIRNFENVFVTKTLGLENLISVIDKSDLKKIILFSSIAGSMGNAGQSDYSMANEVLNYFARRNSLSVPDCDTVAINWGAIDGGMVNESLKKHMQAAGIGVIPIEECTDFFVNEVLYGDCCQVIANYNPYF